jgi:hypothetical protein
MHNVLLSRSANPRPRKRGRRRRPPTSTDSRSWGASEVVHRVYARDGKGRASTGPTDIKRGDRLASCNRSPGTRSSSAAVWPNVAYPHLRSEGEPEACAADASTSVSATNRLPDRAPDACSWAIAITRSPPSRRCSWGEAATTSTSRLLSNAAALEHRQSRCRASLPCSCEDECGSRSPDRDAPACRRTRDHLDGGSVPLTRPAGKKGANWKLRLETSAHTGN